MVVKSDARDRIVTQICCGLTEVTEVTRLLEATGPVSEKLLPLVYEELRKLKAASAKAMTVFCLVICLKLIGVRHAIAATTPAPQTQPAPPQVYDVWPGKPPGEIGNIGQEKFWEKRPDGVPIPNVGGKPVKWLTNVSRPTISVYRRERQGTGASMLICPGGGLTYLAWDAEGEEVAAWLNSIGVTGIILKYRVPRRPDQMAPQFKSIWHVRPLQDAQRNEPRPLQSRRVGIGPASYRHGWLLGRRRADCVDFHEFRSAGLRRNRRRRQNQQPARLRGDALLGRRRFAGARTRNLSTRSRRADREGEAADVSRRRWR